MSGLLSGFETWLRQLPELPRGDATPLDGPDLSTLLREFIALRQEINLLTRATRTQQEQNARTLDELTAALDTLQAAAQPSRATPEPVSESSQLNLKQLIEVRDALGRAEREMQKARANLEQLLAEAVALEPEAEPLPEPPATVRVPWFVRWLGVRGPDPGAWQEYARAFTRRESERRAREEAGKQTRQALLARVRQIVSSLLEGYSMSVQRMDRLLTAHELEAIPAEGQRFNPELMEAMESVAGTGRASGEVVEEVRRGYLQRGRVVRFALVRVARDG